MDRNGNVGLVVGRCPAISREIQGAVVFLDSFQVSGHILFVEY